MTHYTTNAHKPAEQTEAIPFPHLMTARMLRKWCIQQGMTNIQAQIYIIVASYSLMRTKRDCYMSDLGLAVEIGCKRNAIITAKHNGGKYFCRDKHIQGNDKHKENLVWHLVLPLPRFETLKETVFQSTTLVSKKDNPCIPKIQALVSKRYTSGVLTEVNTKNKNSIGELSGQAGGQASPPLPPNQPQNSPIGYKSSLILKEQTKIDPLEEALLSFQVLKVQAVESFYGSNYCHDLPPKGSKCWDRDIEELSCCAISLPSLTEFPDFVNKHTTEFCQDAFKQIEGKPTEAPDCPVRHYLVGQLRISAFKKWIRHPRHSWFMQNRSLGL